MRIIILILLGIGQFLYAQIPQSISYQGIARDNQGSCLINQSLDLDLRILDNVLDPINSTVYAETHNTTTDVNGLFFVELGNGMPVPNAGLFQDIDWSTPKWVETTIDGTNMGIIPFLAVPYAFYAEETRIEYAHESGNAFDSTQLRNQWFTYSGIELTVPEPGTYMILATGRCNFLFSPDAEYGAFRVWNETASSILSTGFIGWAEAGPGEFGDGDQTGTISTFAQLQKGDKLKLQFYINNVNANASSRQAKFGGDQNGQATLSVMKVSS